MPYPPRAPTPQGVGGALKRAGFNRADPRGAGYKVRKSKATPASVEVLWQADPRDCGPAAARRTLTLQRYADVLVGARFRCRLDEPGGKLTVYARG